MFPQHAQCREYYAPQTLVENIPPVKIWGFFGRGTGFAFAGITESNA